MTADVQAPSPGRKSGCYAKLLKVSHLLGAAGVLGSFAICILLVFKTRGDTAFNYAVDRRAIAGICQCIMVPALAVTLVSGLLAIIATPGYKSAGWAWVKALLGIGLFEGTLLTVASSARDAAELSISVLWARPTPDEIQAVVRTEWGGLWVLLTLALANVVLGVWRPRIGPRLNASPD